MREWPWEPLTLKTLLFKLPFTSSNLQSWTNSVDRNLLEINGSFSFEAPLMAFHFIILSQGRQAHAFVLFCGHCLSLDDYSVLGKMGMKSSLHSIRRRLYSLSTVMGKEE